MPLAIGLDSNVLGILAHPKGRDHRAATLWLERHLQAGNQIVIPQIADYELRRELPHLTRMVDARPWQQIAI